jgi:hypothetical protein
MDQRPEAGRIEVENGSHKINDGVIVHQPSRHDPEQRFGHRQLADRGRTMDEKQFHASSIANSLIPGNRQSRRHETIFSGGAMNAVSCRALADI